MAEKAYFFTSNNGDRKYKADDFVAYFKSLVINGVLKDIDSLNLKVNAYSGMKVRVNKGEAIINGYRYENDANLDLTIEASDPINPRIDVIAVRLDISNRTINVVIRKGIAGTVPLKPTLLNNGDSVEIALASVYVGKGIVALTDSNITDEREFSYSYLDVNHTHNLSEMNDDIEIEQQLEVNGYRKNKGGLIEQWGQVEITVPVRGMGTANIVFPTPFPNSCTFATTNVLKTDSGSISFVDCINSNFAISTKTGGAIIARNIDVSLSSPTKFVVNWYAKGY